jgi:2-haloacid dehalogenase
MIKIVLWDIDGTLLNFHAAEQVAIRTLFETFHLGECTDEMLVRYSAINRAYWEKLERGEVSKPEVLEGRFHDFFQLEGIDTSLAPEFNQAYQVSLGDTIVYMDDSYELVKSLKGKVLQYAVSNGTVLAQTKKLRLSGLGELFDGVYLSEDLGVEKPNIAFFDKVFAEIGPIEPSEVIIVGDSLTSDIRGGNNAGILTCWYNPKGDSASEEYRIDYEIRNLQEIRKILNEHE